MKLKSLLPEIKLIKYQKISFDVLKLYLFTSFKEYMSGDIEDSEEDITNKNNAINDFKEMIDAAKNIDDLEDAVGYYGFDNREALYFIISSFVDKIW